MNDDRKQPPPPADQPPASSGTGSGKGADTALEALIRKRKLAEARDEDPRNDLPPPLPPLLPLPPA